MPPFFDFRKDNNSNYGVVYNGLDSGACSGYTILPSGDVVISTTSLAMSIYDKNLSGRRTAILPGSRVGGSVAHFKGLIVCYASGGTGQAFLYSNDNGTTWNVGNFPPLDNIGHDLFEFQAATGHVLCAVNALNGKTYHTSDGINWNVGNTITGSSTQIGLVSGKRFITVSPFECFYVTNSHFCKTSDGSNWTSTAFSFPVAGSALSISYYAQNLWVGTDRGQLYKYLPGDLSTIHQRIDMPLNQFNVTHTPLTDFGLYSQIVFNNSLYVGYKNLAVFKYNLISNTWAQSSMSYNGALAFTDVITPLFSIDGKLYTYMRNGFIRVA